MKGRYRLSHLSLAVPYFSTDSLLSLPAPLVWVDGVPVATGYDDVYYSRVDGLAESQYVYVAGVGWPYAYTGTHTATVGELGFGTGLNLVATWQAWQAADPAHRPAHWHYVAVEGHPLSPQDFSAVAAKTVEQWPVLAPYYQALVAAYHVPGSAVSGAFSGVVSVALTPQIRLTLLCQPVAQAMTHMPTAMDAWYLDGFAPAKNLTMWAPEVLAAVGRHSTEEAKLATFTVARPVRDGLAAAGFDWEKRPGYGKKRHCLVAVKSL